MIVQVLSPFALFPIRKFCILGVNFPSYLLLRCESLTSFELNGSDTGQRDPIPAEARDGGKGSEALALADNPPLC